jgi:osmotically-inducible protein OsmY
VVTGAQLVYDRHDIAKDLNNHNVQAEASRRLFKGPYKFNQSNISASSFNHDLILLGQVPSKEVKDQVEMLVKGTPGVRRVFNELEIRPKISLAKRLHDTWVTTKIRTLILADSKIDPKVFKIITEDGVVYVLGDVRKDQAKRVVELVRNTAGVRRVVRVLRYYSFNKQKA